MNNLDFRRRPARQARPDAAKHLFAVGQTVRLKSGTATRANEIYAVTATLPERDSALQYRIHNVEERHERVVSQDQLVPASTRAGDKARDLIDKTFGRP